MSYIDGRVAGYVPSGQLWDRSGREGWVFGLGRGRTPTCVFLWALQVSNLRPLPCEPEKAHPSTLQHPFRLFRRGELVTIAFCFSPAAASILGFFWDASQAIGALLFPVATGPRRVLPSLPRWP